ncbi:hypothetical protein [Methylosinus sp. R-45379]|uniref:hypothetical protein n=1 Tax=Methylosinus sp. R-45379 TaxID=980563 RepID=UPI0007C8E683|nr:hypothetical protein [Methylosinus sp. R-45379]
MEAPFLQGPRPAIGAAPRVRNDSGAWVFRLVDMTLHDWKILAYRAILLRIMATSGALYLPLWDWRRAPVSPLPGVGFSDGADFSDSSLFASAAPAGLVAAAAEQMTTRFRMTPPSSANLSAGQFIGLGERGYGIFDLEDIAGGDDKMVSIWPPLREALAVGDEVELYDPVIRVRVDITQARTSLGALNLGRRGVVTLEFVEDSW